MLVHHSFALVASCPVDGRPDFYEVTVDVHRILPVEEILEACEALQHRRAFQEEITEELAATLSARVTTRGVHSGVKTVCECVG